MLTENGRTDNRKKHDASRHLFLAQAQKWRRVLLKALARANVELVISVHYTPLGI